MSDIGQGRPRDHRGRPWQPPASDDGADGHQSPTSRRAADAVVEPFARCEDLTRPEDMA